MPRITAEAFRALHLPSSIVWSGACHTAATHRVFVESDIVSTFGRVPAGTWPSRWAQRASPSMVVSSDWSSERR